MNAGDLTPAELAALKACAAGDVWCGLPLAAAGRNVRLRLWDAALILPGDRIDGVTGYRITDRGLALLAASPAPPLEAA